MAAENPYQAPQARVEDAIVDDEGVEQVRSGQKLLIYAVLLNLLGIPFTGTVLVVLIGLVALVISLVGVVRVGRGFGMPTLAKAGLVVLMFVPLVNIITLLLLNGRATRRLRDAGYSVGLMGARAKAS